MPYNQETELFEQDKATIVDSTPDGDSVKEGFDDRLTPAMAGVYADFNILKVNGMIGVGVPATEVGRGIVRVATAAEAASGKTGANGPAAVTPETLKTAISLGMAPVGQIVMLPFRFNQLPLGWYFCNGTRHNNGTAQANALNALSAEFKADWGIINNGATTNVPNWFHTDGRGPTMRAVNGTSRQVGSVEDGAIQNITGSLVRADHRGIGGGSAGGYPLVNSGALKVVENQAGMWGNGSSGGGFSLYFNAADSVRTANETIMLNRGMTPAIFLGV